MSTFTLHSRQAPFTARPALGAGLRRLLDRLAPSRGLTLGALTLAGLLGFELFNYGTTEFALTDLLGWQAFAGVRWATILALAFCAVDFAGIARLFTPDPARKDPAEIWYLLGAWFLAATMNAMLTWWGISLALLRHQGLGNEILGREALLGSVPVFVALLCDPDSVDAEADLTELAVQSVVAEASMEIDGTVSFTTPRDNIVVLVSGADVESARTLALDCAESISEQTVHRLGITLSIGIGSPATGTSEIPDSYADARTALERRLVLGPNHIIAVEQVRGEHAETLPGSERKLRTDFVRSLKTGVPEASLEALDQLVESFQRNGGRVEVCHAAMHRLLADSLNALDDLGVDYSRVPDFGPNPFEQLGRLKTLQELRHWFGEFLDRVTRHIEARRTSHSTRKAAEAEEYVKSHFAEPRLSLSRICRELSISKSYFSPMFKTQTGMTFVEYLTALRMEHAKELLSTEDLRSYEIADRVGFSDPHYVSLTFKKQIGLTPTEYRERTRRASAGASS